MFIVCIRADRLSVVYPGRRREVAIEYLHNLLSGGLFVSFDRKWRLWRHAAFWRILKRNLKIFIVDAVLHFDKNLIQLNALFLFLKLQFLR